MLLYQATRNDYRKLILSHGPRAYWRLGEPSGTVAVDETGAYNGVYSPSSSGAWTGGTQGASGALTGDGDKAAQFTGAALGRVVRSSIPMSSAVKSTIECWLYRAASSHIAVAGFGVNLQRFNIDAFSDGNLYVAAEAGATAYSVCAIGTGWRHVAAVFDGAQSGNAARLTVYIDGVSQALTFTGTIPATLSSAIGDFAIGYEVANNISSTGKLDEVALYARALTAAEILAHYNKGIAA